MKKRPSQSTNSSYAPPERNGEMHLLLNADQLGEILQCTGATVRRWHREGMIPAAVSEGNIIRFEESAVRKMLRERAKTRQPKSLPDFMLPTY